MSTTDHTTSIEYREIHRFLGYRFGFDGSVWSRWKRVSLGFGKGTAGVLGETWQRLSPNISTPGYLTVQLREANRRYRRHQIHRLVLEAFTGPPPFGYYACHKDNDKHNNCLDNLKWDTPAANTAQGRNREPFAEDDIRQIRLMGQQGHGLGVIAQRYGVAKSCICRILKRQAWKHVLP